MRREWSLNRELRSADKNLVASPEVYSGDPAAGPQLELSKREQRGIRLIERYPWVPVVALTFLWVCYLSSVWYQFGVLAEHGAVVGISSRGEVWHLAIAWSEHKRPFPPYEVFVIDRVNTFIWEGALLIVLTLFTATAHHQNRLILKLVRALRASGA